MWQSLATADVVGSLAGAIYLATAIRPQMQKDAITNPLVLEEGRFVLVTINSYHNGSYM